MGSERAFLKSRQQKLDLDTKVGKVEIINPTLADSSRGAGYWCEVCSCLLKDSVSYLDHINGRKRKFTCLLQYHMTSLQSLFIFFRSKSFGV